jgi:membrane protease YdiL (CAAX protease family)
MPINLPVAALMAFVPMVAALILRIRKDGWLGARALVAKVFDIRRKSAGWYLIAALIMPALLIAEYWVLRILGVALPQIDVPVATVAIFLLMFVAGAIGEELGWQGYAFAQLDKRWTALQASLVIGSFWALWHLIPFIQAERDAAWIVWQTLAMLPLRIITVWLFINAGESVVAAVIFHAMSNMAQFLFPNLGSHYDPLVLLGLLSIVAAGIVVVYGKTLRR